MIALPMQVLEYERDLPAIASQLFSCLSLSALALCCLAVRALPTSSTSWALQRLDCCHLQFFFLKNLAVFQPSPALTCRSMCILVAPVAAERSHIIFSCSLQCIVLKARLVLHTCGCHQPLAECLLWQNAP